jgi:tetratricopeptide (TPR) repeat protein
VVFGLFIVLFFEAIYALFARVSSAMLSAPARRVLGWVGGFYAAATFAAYLVALAGQYSSGVAGMVSASMLRAFRTIRMDDPSLLTRAFATRDAFKIWLRHPLLGGGAGAWNAWYHAFQRVLYWTTEVHNHFAQVLVETGFLGFAAYVSVWAGMVTCAVRSLVAARRRGPADDSRGVALTWGLATACVAVGIHSAMDFELSLPGIAVQLYAVFGVVHGWTLDAHSPSGARAERPGRQSGRTGRLISAAAWVLLGLAALALIVPPFFLQRGAWYGGLGAVALANQDYYTAVRLYDRSQRYDPLTASYAVDKAQAYAAMALLGGRADARGQALAELRCAELLEPFNLACRLKEAEVLTGLGELESALQVWSDLVSMLPLDIRMYEGFAKLNVVSYMDALREAAAAGEARPPASAETWLSDVTALPDKLNVLRAGVTGVYRARWDPGKLEATPSLNTYIGQAYYLEGDLKRAIDFFGKALSDASRPAEAQAWMAASRVLAGQIAAADVSGEALHVMWYYRPVAR